MLENKFQSDLIKTIYRLLPGCIVFKMDPKYIQGFPDILILYENKWAALECKKSKTATHRPNQDYYVELLNKMSFASFIYPENKEEVLNELERSFGVNRNTCAA